MLTMTPRGMGKKNSTSTNKSSAKKFVFPSEEEKKASKAEKDVEKDEGMLSKEELYALLQTRNEELEECREQFEALQ